MSIIYVNYMHLLEYRGIFTHQVECFAVWFDFMFLHVFYKAAVCVSVIGKEKICHAFGAITPHKNRELLHSNKCKLCTTLKDVFLPADMALCFAPTLFLIFKKNWDSDALQTYVFLLKSFISVECSGIFLMSSQSLSVKMRERQDYATSHPPSLQEQII